LRLSRSGIILQWPVLLRRGHGGAKAAITLWVLGSVGDRRFARGACARLSITRSSASTQQEATVETTEPARESPNSDQIQFRGWRIWVSTPLGFFALVLILIVPILGTVAMTSGPLRWFAGGALVVFPAALVALVARLAVLHPHALTGKAQTGARRRRAKSTRSRR